MYRVSGFGPRASLELLGGAKAGDVLRQPGWALALAPIPIGSSYVPGPTAGVVVHRIWGETRVPLSAGRCGCARSKQGT
jgi:hypothetical protein